MPKLYFLAQSGEKPHTDANIRGLCEVHSWTPGGATLSFGCAIPRPGVDPNDVEDALTAFGVRVLPGLDGNPDASILQMLGPHGAKPGHKTRDVARALHAASGFRPLKPHDF